MGEDVQNVILFFTYKDSFWYDKRGFGVFRKTFMHKRKRRKKDELF